MFYSHRGNMHGWTAHVDGAVHILPELPADYTVFEVLYGARKPLIHVLALDRDNAALVLLVCGLPRVLSGSNGGPQTHVIA